MALSPSRKKSNEADFVRTRGSGSGVYGVRRDCPTPSTQDGHTDQVFLKQPMKTSTIDSTSAWFAVEEMLAM